MTLWTIRIANWYKKAEKSVLSDDFLNENRVAMMIDHGSVALSVAMASPHWPHGPNYWTELGYRYRSNSVDRAWVIWSK